jgi:hypothetical protein
MCELDVELIPVRILFTPLPVTYAFTHAWTNLCVHTHANRTGIDTNNHNVHAHEELNAKKTYTTLNLCRILIILFLPLVS